MTATSNGRKVSMNAQACFEFAQTNEGAVPLVNPSTFKTSSKDPHRGLYPRERSKLRSRHPGGPIKRQPSGMGNMLRREQPSAGPSSAASEVTSIMEDLDCRLQDFVDDDVVEGSITPSSNSNSLQAAGRVDGSVAGFQSAKLFMADSVASGASKIGQDNSSRKGGTKRLPKYLTQQHSLQGDWLKCRTVPLETASCSSDRSSESSNINSNVISGSVVNKSNDSLVESEKCTFSFKDLLQSPSKDAKDAKNLNTRRNMFFPSPSTISRSSTVSNISPSHRTIFNENLKRSASFAGFNSDSNQSSVSSPKKIPTKAELPWSHTKDDASPLSKHPKWDVANVTTPPRRRKKPVQKNTLLNYFVPSPVKSASTVSASTVVKLEPKTSSDDIIYISSDESPRAVSSSTNFVSTLIKHDSKAISSDDVVCVSSEDDIVCVKSVKPVLHNRELKRHDKVKSIPKSENEVIPKLILPASSSMTKQDEIKILEEFNDVYGLLGNLEDDAWDTGDEDSCKSNPFEQLPSEILESIFCQIAMVDLALTFSRVCKQWNDVISRKNFLLWKKTYFRLKNGNDTSTRDHIRAMCITYQMTSSELSLINLISFMKNFKTRHIPNVTSCLRWHPKYSMAVALIEERLPECMNKEEPNPWCLIAALCILSHSVADILAVQACLTHTKSSCTIYDMLECLYCVATFLYHFKKDYRINSGYHYRLYYALYLFENKGTVTVGELGAFSAKTAGQQSIRKYGNQKATTRLTHEQLRIVNHNLQSNQLVKIVAFAGTGKTTTLIEFTKLWPSKKFLNIAYNKTVSEHAKTLFPINVCCRTIHSLAYGAVGCRFRGKLKFKVTAFDVFHVLTGNNLTVRAGRALKAIEKFVNTADPFITIAHTPDRPTRSSVDDVPLPFSDEEKLEIAADATQVWESMKNPGNYSTKITHDVYLKLYQLSSPVISEYDCLLVDEAQDCNGAMLDIIMSQRCPKIIVGDPHQQIYSFRGAVNALDNVSATHVYYLTQSFRFGPDIGYVASCALEVMKNEHRKTIVGGTHAGGFDGREEGQVAIIARTNMSLFTEAVRLCCRGARPIHGAFLGGIKTYNMNQTTDIYKLMQVSNGEGTKESLGIKDNFIKRFTSFAKLCDYARKVDDVELMGRIKIVQLFGHELPGMIKKITEQCSYPLETAEYIFSTAHKAKGHEFDTVRLTEDYVVHQFRVIDKSLAYVAKGPDLDEANILYVAVTRAKRRLVMSSQVLLLMITAGEKFELPHWTETLVEEKWLEGEEWECVVCQLTRNSTVEKAVTIMRRAITTTRFTLPAGRLCFVCAAMPLLNLNQYRLSQEVQTMEPVRDPSRESMWHMAGPLATDEVKSAEEWYAGTEDELNV